MIKTWWKKLIVVVLCFGAQGGLMFVGNQYPVWSAVTNGLILAVTGTMFILTGFPPKTETK